MSKQASFRVLVNSRNNFSGNIWDVQLDGAAYGDLGNINVGAIFISDEGGQTYFRWIVVDVDTDGAPSGTTRWFRIEPDEDGTPPGSGPNWNDGWIMNPVASGSLQGWKTYPEEFGINSAMDAYALNADKYALQQDFVQFSDLIADSSGAVDAGKPIKLNESGVLDTSFYNAGGGAADSVTVDTTAFDGILSGSDIDVQTALETIDDHSHDSAASLLAMKEPTGFANKADSTMTWNDTTRRFTIAPASSTYDIWHKGVKITKSGTDAVIIPNTDGVHYISFNGSGVLSSSQTVWDLAEVVPVAVIYWNSGITTGYMMEERHGLSMDWATHKYLHTTVGTRYVSGFALSGYVLNSDTTGSVTVELAAGKISDEDLEHSIVHSGTPTNPFEQVLTDPAYIPVWRREGSSGVWRQNTATAYPTTTTGTGRLAWNEFTGGSWTQTEVTNNYYVAYWIVATNMPSQPIKAIQGQRVDSTLQTAQTNNKWDLMSFGDFPFPEVKVLYRVIYQTSNTYATPNKNMIVDVTDYRSVSPLPSGSYVATDHGTLSGLADQDHPASAIFTSTANFNSGLTTTETSVQLALDKLDDLSYYNYVVSNVSEFEAALTSSVRTKRILMKEGTYDMTTLAIVYDATAGDWLEIKGQGEVQINLNLTNGSLFRWDDAGLSALELSCLSYDSTTYTFDEIPDTTGVSAGDVIFFGEHHTLAERNAGKHTIASFDATSITVTEPPIFIGDQTSTNFRLNVFDPNAGVTFILDNLKINHITGNNELFDYPAYPYFKKFLVRNCELKTAYRFEYDYLCTYDEFRFENCSLYGMNFSSNISLHCANAENCKMYNVRVQTDSFSSISNTTFILCELSFNYHTINTLLKSWTSSDSVWATMTGCTFVNCTTSTGTAASLIHTYNEVKFAGNGGQFYINSRYYDAAVALNPSEVQKVRTTTGTDSIYVDDCVVLCNFSSSGTLTIETDAVTLKNRSIKIKDISGNALTNNITIDTANTDTIDGQASVVIDVNYASVTLVSNGTNWFLV